MQEVKGGFFRRIYAGLIGVLDNKIRLERDWLLEPEVIPVPFYPSMVGSERYMQDFFLNLADHKSDGGNDIIPRGTIELPTINVVPASSTNKYVRAEYDKEADGIIQTYTAQVNSIPLSLTFPCEIVVESMNDMLYITELILDIFYKVQTFDIVYRGMAVPVQVGFPDTVSYEKALNLAYSEGEKPKIRFELNVETYLPSLDMSTQLFRGATMTKLTNSIESMPEGNVLPGVYLGGIRIDKDNYTDR